MNVALVYDRVNKIGGAERVLSELHEIFPDAPLYTAVYNPKKALWARDFDVRTSFLNRIPFAKNHHEWFAWLTPFAFASFNFDAFDVVITVTSAEAKGIITKPDTLHICYCLTPTRYLWSGSKMYAKETGFGVFHGLASFVFTRLLPTLRSWDMIASQRPDIYIAISKRVKERIKTYYKRDVEEIIYPPVQTDVFIPSENKKSKDEYYLLVSRLVPYKRADIVVQACTNLGKKLIVIGSGPDLLRLKMMAGPKVTFISHNLTDKAIVEYYQNCRAFLYAGDEDFGIVAAEAQSCGKPVIAFKDSGVSEIVIPGKTGVVFASQNEKDLENAIKQFERMDIQSSVCRQNALRFDRLIFQKKFLTRVEDLLRKYNKTI